MKATNNLLLNGHLWNQSLKFINSHHLSSTSKSAGSWHKLKLLSVSHNHLQKQTYRQKNMHTQPYTTHNITERFGPWKIHSTIGSFTKKYPASHFQTVFFHCPIIKWTASFSCYYGCRFILS